MQGVARNEIAKEFLDRRVGQRSVRFDVSAYGNEAPGILARAWVHKMQWFLEHEYANPSLVDQPIPLQLFNEYSEPSEFTKLATTASGALLRRVKQIRSVFAN